VQAVDQLPVGDREQPGQRRLRYCAHGGVNVLPSASLA